MEIALLFSKKRRVVNTNGRFGKIFSRPPLHRDVPESLDRQSEGFGVKFGWEKKVVAKHVGIRPCVELSSRCVLNFGSEFGFSLALQPSPRLLVREERHRRRRHRPQQLEIKPPIERPEDVPAALAKHRRARLRGRDGVDLEDRVRKDRPVDARVNREDVPGRRRVRLRLRRRRRAQREPRPRRFTRRDSHPRCAARPSDRWIRWV